MTQNRTDKQLAFFAYRCGSAKSAHSVFQQLLLLVRLQLLLQLLLQLQLPLQLPLRSTDRSRQRPT